MLFTFSQNSRLTDSRSAAINDSLIIRRASPVLLLLRAQGEAVVLGVGLVSLPVHQLHPQRVLALAAQQVQGFVSQPVLSQHVAEALQTHERQGTGLTQTSAPASTHHFILPPAPLEIHAAVESPLEDGPSSAARLHVTVNLQEPQTPTVTAR